MKKILYNVAIAISILFIYQDSNAQAFQKGNKNIDVGVGFGLYATTTTLTVQLPFLGSTTIVENDGAASTLIPIEFEYGVSDKIGIGAQLGFSNYFIDDSTEVKSNGIATGEMEDNTTESVKSIDFAIKVNYHLLNADRNDLFIGLALGVSNVTWNDQSGEALKGKGSYFSIYIKDRIFFSDNIGILFNLGYTRYNYSNITASSSNATINSLKWNLGGVNIGTGLAVKF